MIDRVGRYRLLREIGRGGMGAVYLAERDVDFAQRVAIKTVSGVMDAEALRWFASERRILASLEHPGIARLLDGGTTAEGVPYLAMEYVEGTPINNRYCDAQALPVSARIGLFLRVCEAVSHAHRRLIVHRDLKPSNILVTTDGSPKLLDFGIATLVDDPEQGGPHAGAPARTRASMCVLTPQYASPEQLRGVRVTTASDVYALGLILYELVAGRRPYDLEGLSPGEFEQVVCQQEPPRSGRGGDLDTIVMKALRKEPEQRYTSVEALAEDLERFLDGRPVAARPATWTYVARRFTQRHPGGVAAAAAFVVTVAAFGVALAWSATRARHERDTAERVTSGLIQLFSGSDLRATNGDTITVRELVDRGTATLNRELDGASDVQTQLTAAVGAVYESLGLRAPGSISRPEPAPWRGEDVIDSPAAARALMRLAESLRARRQLAAAEASARRSLAMTRRIFGASNPQVGESLDTLSMIVYERGRREDAERLFVEMIDVFRDSLGPTHPIVATGLHRLAMSRRDAGDLAGAERLLREAVAIRRWVFAQTAWDIEVVLAGIVDREGHPDEGERLMRDALDALRGGSHSRLGDAEKELADMTRAHAENHR